MHSINYLDLGDYDNAGSLFDLSYKDNMHAPFHVWTETPSGNACNFITGAGGFLQTVTAGYPGLRIGNDALSFTPLCIPGISYMKLKQVTYLTSDLSIEYWCADNDVNSPASYSPYPVDAKVTLLNANGKSTLMVSSTIKNNGKVVTSPVSLSSQDAVTFVRDQVKLAHKMSSKITLKLYQK